MDTVFVKPASGGRIRMPERAYAVMPAEGKAVPLTAYYQRLIDSGDLIPATPAAPAAENKPAAPKDRRSERNA